MTAPPSGCIPALKPLPRPTSHSDATTKNGIMAEKLVDTFGRVHNNVRISITDRCNLRCFYCMPADNVQFMERTELLTFEEITRFVRVAVSLGVEKVRLTGGEPLVRRDVHRLVEGLVAI